MPDGNPQKGELWRKDDEYPGVAWKIEHIAAQQAWMFPALDGATEQAHDRHMMVGVAQLQNDWQYVDPKDTDNKFAVVRQDGGRVQLDFRLIRDGLSRKEAGLLAAWLVAAARLNLRDIANTVEVAKDRLRQG